MRIISGKLKGRRFNPPEVEGFRPTSDRVREAIFSVLTSELLVQGRSFEGSQCLDLYAGSGAFGLEALSRGAAWVTFVERNARLVRALEQLIESLGLKSETRVVSQVVEAFLATGGKLETYDIIFADPPYGAKSCEDFCMGLMNSGKVNLGALLVFESDEESEKLSIGPCGGLVARRLKQKTYGSTWVNFFVFEKETT